MKTIKIIFKIIKYLPLIVDTVIDFYNTLKPHIDAIKEVNTLDSDK